MKKSPSRSRGTFRSIYKTQSALAALLSGFLLAALLSALTAGILLLLSGFLLIGLLLAALLTAMLAALAALLPALILVHVRHWKRLLFAGWPRKISTNRRNVGSERRGRNLELARDLKLMLHKNQ
jgi:type III secretory pathway component EscR